MHRLPAARRLLQAAESLCRGALQGGRTTEGLANQSQLSCLRAWGPATSDRWRWRGFADQSSGNGAAPSTGSTDADGDGLSAAQPATASQSSAAPASASALPAQGNSGSGAAAEGGADEGNPSAEARVVESSAELAAEVPDADDEAAAGSDEADGDEDEWDIELTPEGLRYATTRWDGSRNMTPNRRPTREEREGYIDNEELQEELDHVAVPIPGDIGMYDIQTTLPGLVSPTSAGLDALMEFGPAGIEAILEEFEEMEDEAPPPRPGAQPILEWEITMVLDTSGSWDHPANRKAVCRVYLRDLQREMGLSDDALQHVALVCGPRYSPSTGQLKLVCERYAERDENRAHILEQLYALAEEGRRVHPPQQAAAALTS